MTKVIILGASGFIGGRLLQYFKLDENYNVKGYSSKECDLLSPDSINHVLSSINKSDVIIMASSITRLKNSSFDSMIKNIEMTENISRFFENRKVGYLIFLSSIDVYGDVGHNIRISEKLIPNPNDYYGISKLCSELILKKCCLKYKIPLSILRLPGIYGPGDKRKSTLGILIDSALNGKITIFEDGRDKRDFVYVDDLCRIIKIAIKKQISATLNIATGKSYTINEIVETIKSNFPDDVAIKHVFKGVSKKSRSYDINLFKRFFPNFKFTDINNGILLYMKSI